VSRKDYVAIAALLHDHAQTTADPTQAVDIAVRDLVDGIADLFAQDNPNFDRRRFDKAVFGEQPLNHRRNA
jgi:hypothetical protein